MTIKTLPPLYSSLPKMRMRVVLLAVVLATFMTLSTANLVPVHDSSLVHDLSQVPTHLISSTSETFHQVHAEARLELQKAKHTLKLARYRFEIVSQHWLEHVRESARLALVQAEENVQRTLSHLKSLMTSHGYTWHTNTTMPPPGEWLLHIEFDCWVYNCQFRVLKLHDWDVTTQWQVNGTGSYDTPLSIDRESYFFRYQGGDALVSWIPLPPPLPAERNNLLEVLPLAGLIMFVLIFVLQFYIIIVRKI